MIEADYSTPFAHLGGTLVILLVGLLQRVVPRSPRKGGDKSVDTNLVSKNSKHSSSVQLGSRQAVRRSPKELVIPAVRLRGPASCYPQA